jgi:plasmid stabilization system protein ParE
MKPIRFHPLVLKDFTRACDYYEQAADHCLVEQFEKSVSSSLQRIQSAPHEQPFYLGQKAFRRMKLRTFPYLILYRETPDEIRITAIKHEKRHPTYGLKRR